jgi:hypothetical protein
MKIKYLKISEIKPYEKNPRLNNDTIELLIKSIKEYGFNVPILIDEKNIILAGHARYKAAQKLEIDKVPTIKITHLNESQKKAFRIADNKSSEYAEWDYKLLKDVIEDITINNFDIENIFFKNFEIDDIIFNSEIELNNEIENNNKQEISHEQQLAKITIICPATSKNDVIQFLNNILKQVSFTNVNIK